MILPTYVVMYDVHMCVCVYIYIYIYIYIYNILETVSYSKHQITQILAVPRVCCFAKLLPLDSLLGIN